MISFIFQNSCSRLFDFLFYKILLQLFLNITQYEKKKEFGSNLCNNSSLVSLFNNGFTRRSYCYCFSKHSIQFERSLLFKIWYFSITILIHGVPMLKLCEQKTDWLKDLILSVINDFFKKIWVNLRQGMEDYTLNLLFPKLSIVEAEVNIMFFFNSSSLFHFLRNEFPDYLYKYWTSMSNLNYKG